MSISSVLRSKRDGSSSQWAVLRPECTVLQSASVPTAESPVSVTQHDRQLTLLRGRSLAGRAVGLRCVLEYRLYSRSPYETSELCHL
eukprot:2955999-Prymnesium_polylepis.1